MEAAPVKFLVCHSIPSRLRVKVQDIRHAEKAAAALEHWLATQVGVQKITANPVTGSVILHYNPEATSVETLFELLEEGVSQLPQLLETVPWPCPKPLSQREPRDELDLKLGLAKVIGLTAFLGWHLISSFFLGSPLSPAVLTGAAIIGALPLWRRAVTDLLNFRFIGLNPLLGTAAVLAVATGEALTALEVIWILEIGELLEGYLVDRSRRAIKEILQVAAKDTFVLVDGVEVEIPVDRVQRGDIVAVHAMEKIPVDGMVVSGEALVDQAHITGRAEPELKEVGELVFAGTIVQQGKIHLRAEKVGEATYLSQIVCLVESSLENRPQAEKQVELLAARLVRWGIVAVMGTLLLTWDPARIFAVMLVMSCPCATILAASTAVTAALANAADRLILIKGGLYLEQFGKIDVFCFDKTGTLTTGVPRVANIVTGYASVTPQQVLTLVAAAEVRNPHPLARALVTAARTADALPPAGAAVPEIFLGRGVRTNLGSETVTVGNEQFMADQGIDFQAFRPTAQELEDAGQTVVYVARNGKIVGLVSITYETRGDLQTLVKKLRRDGVEHFHLISGDSAKVVESLAKSLKFDGHRGNLMPEEKAGYVEELIAAGHTVAVIGDGVNDALALSKASVGVAMGAGGAEPAIAAADIALADDDLRKLIFVRQLSQQTVRIIHQNYWLAVGTDLAGSVLALVGLLSPVMGGVLHVSHALAITANSGRLLTWQPR
jgi:cation-transporting P-type ATPase C